jgi:hypothetical protein
VLYILPADQHAAASRGVSKRGAGRIGLEDYVAGAEPGEDLAEVRLAYPGYFDALPSPVPDKRSVILISGAGKSHRALHFCLNYKKLFPERKVLLVSAVQRDATLDQLPGLVRLDSAKFLSAGLPKMDALTETLVIIDDVEGLPDDQLVAVFKFQDATASMGRHTNTSLLRLLHLSTDHSRMWAAHASSMIQQFKYLDLSTSMSDAEKRAFKEATACCLGLQAFPRDAGLRPREARHVRHHCHVTGDFIGAACQGCNVNGKTKYKVPCFSHDAKAVHPLLLATAATGGRTEATLRDPSFVRLKVAGNILAMPTQGGQKPS